MSFKKLGGDFVNNPHFQDKLFIDPQKNHQRLSKLESITLYGTSIQSEESYNEFKVFHLKNDSGVGKVTIYPVFPGIELTYNDIHMRFCESPANNTNQIIEINHCRQGRYECHFRKQDYCYMEPGDFSISSYPTEKKSSCFPLRDYHGISIMIDMNRIDAMTINLMEYMSIDLNHIAVLLKDRNYYILRASNIIEHIFSELYTVRDHIKSGYIKVKVLELLLMLTDLNPNETDLDRPYFSKAQIDAVNEIHDFILDNIAEHYTLDELANRFKISPTVMKKCFKGVYGDSIYSYLKKCRLEMSAQLLAVGDKNIGEIAMFIGYDNPAKFSSAFKKTYGISPREYQKSRNG